MSVDRDEEDIARDARLEWRLVPKAVLAIAIVVVIVVIREMILR